MPGSEPASCICIGARPKGAKVGRCFSGSLSLQYSLAIEADVNEPWTRTLCIRLRLGARLPALFQTVLPCGRVASEVCATFCTNHAAGVRSKINATPKTGFQLK